MNENKQGITRDLQQILEKYPGLSDIHFSTNGDTITYVLNDVMHRINVNSNPLLNNPDDLSRRIFLTFGPNLFQRSSILPDDQPTVPFHFLSSSRRSEDLLPQNFLQHNLENYQSPKNPLPEYIKLSLPEIKMTEQ